MSKDTDKPRPHIRALSMRRNRSPLDRPDRDKQNGAKSGEGHASKNGEHRSAPEGRPRDKAFGGKPRGEFDKARKFDKGGRFDKKGGAGGKESRYGKGGGRDKKGRDPNAPERIVGIYVAPASPGAPGRIEPADRRLRPEITVAPDSRNGAENGELVVAELPGGRSYGPVAAKIIERLGPADGPRAISLIALALNDIPMVFPDEALAEAESARPLDGLEGRTDLRDVPLITIDGEDARDFDDAVYATQDADPGNPGGWHLVVAIADVSHYVKPGRALDREAEKRGNSVYLPDRVVPMLPEALSNELCSLKPNVDRACLAVHLWIDAKGELRHSRFVRGVMRSRARLTYEQVQKAQDGSPDATTAPLLDAVIRPLYRAFAVLLAGRQNRGTLDLAIAEYKVRVNRDTGQVEGIDVRQRLAAHMLIEEFMVLANVAAAKILEGTGLCLYRVHEPPPPEKLETLRNFIAPFGLKLSPGQKVDPKLLMGLLTRVAGKPEAGIVNEMMLRSQSQAVYSPENLGHFGLNLVRYAHFTSPIRRYADLLVHRALIKRCKLPGLETDALDERAAGRLEQIADHLSGTERRAASAERGAAGRYTAMFLSDRIGETFAGTIGGVVQAGLFVRLEGLGAEGFVSVSSLRDDYYTYDEAQQALQGRRTRRRFRLGDPVSVVLVQADGIKERLTFELRPGAGTIAKGEAPRESQAARHATPYRGDRPRQDRPREDRPREDRSRQDRPRGDWQKPRDGYKPREGGERDFRRPNDARRDDRRRDDRPRDDRPRGDSPRSDRPRDERRPFGKPFDGKSYRGDRDRGAPGAERQREDRPREDRPRQDRPRQDRPRGDWQKPRDGYKPREGDERDFRRSNDGGRRDDRRRDERPRDDRPRGDSPRTDRPRDEKRPFGKPFGGKPYRGDRDRGAPGGERQREDRPREDRPRQDRPRSDWQKPRDGYKPREGAERTPRPAGDRAVGDRPRQGQFRDGQKFKSGDRPKFGKPSFGKSGSTRPFAGRPRTPRPDRKRDDPDDSDKS